MPRRLQTPQFIAPIQPQRDLSVPEIKAPVLKAPVVWGQGNRAPASSFEGSVSVKPRDTKSAAELAAPALALIADGKDSREALNNLILEAKANNTLPQLFEGVVQAGEYEHMLKALGGKNTPALRALADARPTYDESALNAATEANIKAHPEWKTQFAYDALIIPGYTPVKADKPMALEDLPVATQRLDLAVQDFKDGKIPVILVSGGAVHPSGTPHNEGLMMRQYLIDHGVPADRILTDAHARHSTTNLRNAGRMMNNLGLERGLIATGFDGGSAFNQHFYFARPVISTFHLRSLTSLGYEVGHMKDVDSHHVAFKPSSKCDRQHLADPLDP